MRRLTVSDTVTERTRCLTPHTVCKPPRSRVGSAPVATADQADLGRPRRRRSARGLHDQQRPHALVGAEADWLAGAAARPVRRQPERVWASGSLGTVLRTIDGARTWRSASARPAPTTLQFRDIEAFDARPRRHPLDRQRQRLPRLRHRRTAARTGRETFRNADPNAFYDCMTFFDRRHGLALSDPVDGQVPDHRDRRRRPQLARPSTGRHAGGAGRRVRLRGQRAVPGRRHGGTTRGSRPAAARRRASSTPTTAARTGRSADTPIPSGARPASSRSRSATRGTASPSAATSPRPTASPDAPRSPATAAPLAGSRAGAERVPLRRRLVAAPRASRSARPAATSASTAAAPGTPFDDRQLRHGVVCAGNACWASGEQGRVARLVRSK